jgi:xanthine dehydrogenase accessory factor
MSTPMRERGKRVVQRNEGPAVVGGTRALVDSGTAPGDWLRPLRKHWADTLCRHFDWSESAMVRVVVADVRGSAPREPGACMLISQNEIYGTIGGGNLEWHGIAAARALLVAGTSVPAVRVRHLVLGRELGQCCGGVVHLWLERFTRSDLPLLRRAVDAISNGGAAVITTELSGYRVIRRLTASGEALPGPNMRGGIRLSSADPDTALLSERIQQETTPVWLYGAGHVGQALIRVLADLPFEITWIDPRASLLPEKLPENVRPICSRSPVDEVPTAPADARHLVMTHDHALDYALCHAILVRGDFLWLGLIGSKSKGARFRSRLLRDGVPAEMIQRLTCPIGIAGVSSKQPAAIAVAIAAQLLLDRGAAFDDHRTASPNHSGASSDSSAASAAGSMASHARAGASDKAFRDDCSLRECSECSSAQGRHA